MFWTDLASALCTFIYICQMVRFYLATPIPLQTWRLQNSIILKFFLYRLQQLKSEYFLLMWCWFKKNVCFCFLYSNFYEYSHFFNNLKFMFNKLLYVGDVLHAWTEEKHIFRFWGKIYNKLNKKIVCKFFELLFENKDTGCNNFDVGFFFCSLCPKPLTNWILFFQLHNIYLVLCIVFQTLVTWRHSTFSKYFFINSFLKSLLILQILFIFSNSTSSRFL
jgi:hypothetical protein